MVATIGKAEDIWRDCSKKKANYIGVAVGFMSIGVIIMAAVEISPLI
ncbi:TPA: hypothetical protein HA338_07100 [Methanosarcina acetivorans]|uniref:Uncharacterized protein n=1 Tax=Methanosarcina acetivorans TaxID=2214 RepID=A0A832SHK0_9EURY|nr:hypothetical protein [Methanosarcina acetivorans]HIH93807.1 hypothetical protein [Methanosarcina acetivorans]